MGFRFSRREMMQGVGGVALAQSLATCRCSARAAQVAD